MNRLPSCVGKTHKQIWAEFRRLYPELSEAALKEIHVRWVKAYEESKV